jgi:proteasome accessory factor C
VNERLRRLLLLVPAARARPGVLLTTLAAELACTPAELQEDIELLGLVGAPPFQPDDFIEIEVRNGGVWVHLPQGVDRPARLTSTEAAVLAAAVRSVAPDDPVLQRAESRISEAVQVSQRPLYEALRERLLVPAGEGSTVITAVLTEAIARRQEVEILYFARTDRAAAPRTVRPRVIVDVDGVPYLSAQKADGEDRWYRLDRISRATLKPARFQALSPVTVDAAVRATAKFEQSAELPRATVRFDAKVAAAAKVRHPGARVLDDGRVETALPYATLPWIVSYVLSWGGQAELVAPPEARDALRIAVNRALDAHRRRTGAHDEHDA